MQQKLQEYARLLIEVGLNLQKNQTLVIACPVDCAWFARLCAAAAYNTGCREVVMNWRDDNLSRQKYLFAANDVFDSCPPWVAQFYNGYANDNAAYLAISASDPENLKGVDPDRILRNNRSIDQATGDFHKLQMANGFQWCVASISIPSWAKKTFPNCPDEQAVSQLWDAIFQSIRISGDGRAVQRWHDHLLTLQQRVEKLNALRLDSLHYSNSLGTNLTIQLPKDHLWAGGKSVTPGGVEFIANMPTEEIFTAPLKTGINGVVYASRPLVNDGNIIEDFHFVIEDGKITQAVARSGQDHLQAAISTDEGASFFGEVALVPFDSPISNQNLLYYNTLFDENASCHLAFGEAYPECIRGGESMSQEQLAAHGLNHSLTHVDFMVGTADLDITGTTQDGRQVPIFTHGNFAF